MPAQSLLESDMRSDGRAGISAAGEMMLAQDKWCDRHLANLKINSDSSLHR
jgi:hypothetical protein